MPRRSHYTSCTHLAFLDMVAVSVVCIAVVSCCSFLSCSVVYWLTASSAVWLCELHVGNIKGSHWLTSLRRRKESLAGSLSPQRHRVNVFVCVWECVCVFFAHVHKNSSSWRLPLPACALLMLLFLCLHALCCFFHNLLTWLSSAIVTELICIIICSITSKS